MMKHAKANNFNFNANLNKKFGVLRSFVKKCKQAKKEELRQEEEQEEEEYY